MYHLGIVTNYKYVVTEIDFETIRKLEYIGFTIWKISKFNNDHEIDLTLIYARPNPKNL